MSLTTLALAKIALAGVAGASPTLMPNAKTEIVRHTQHSQATLCDGEWVEVTTTVPFGPLAGHSTTFDELRGVTVILKSDGETWELQNGNWQLITSGGPARVQHASCWDSTLQKVIVFGGESASGKLNDLWSWDGTTWEQLDNGLGNAPSPRSYTTLVHDTARNVYVVCGGYDTALRGDTWEWSAEFGWDHVSDGGPDAIYAHNMVYDAVNARTVLHGGYAWGNRDDTWSWDGSTWTSIAPGGPARYVFSMEYDSHGERIIAFGGTQCCAEIETTELWELHENTWTSCGTTNSIDGRGYCDWSYDSLRNCMVIVGGYGQYNGAGGRVPLPDHWEYKMPLIDCNNNGTADFEDVATGYSEDANANNVPDECECFADVNGDGTGNVLDILMLLENWGQTGPIGDTTNDGTVNVDDILYILDNWGACT
jgi:hypothetical protein